MKALCTEARKWVLGSTVALGLWCAPQAFAADDPEPAITVKTAAFEVAGVDNLFTFCIDVDEPIYIDVDCGFGLVEFEIEPSTEGTWFPCSVTPEGVVKIYTDKPEVINYLYCQGGHITEIDLSKLPRLQVLDLSNNKLKKLDLSNNKELQYLDLGTNPFSDEPLYIGSLPSLMALEVESVGNISPDFTLTNFPELVTFSAFCTYNLEKIDPSGCPKLQRLAIDVTKVSTIDVSKNPELTVLNVADTHITSLDLSKNKKLTQLYIGHEGSFAPDYKFSSLDISSNPNLKYLYSQANNLKTLDISNNPNLTELKIRRNYLETLDYSNNPFLYDVDISENCFDFATLPLDPPFSYYAYEQRPLTVAPSYPVNGVLNLSNRVLREDVPTDMRLMGVSQSNIREPYEIPAEYYEYNDGVIKFNRECTDSVYAEFTNAFFPECVLTTTKFMVKSQEQYGVPARTLSFTPVAGAGETIAFGIGADGASETSPRTLFVDFGDGIQVPVQVTCQVPTEPNVEGTRPATGSVNIYVNDGDGLTGLLVDGYQLYDIELDKAPLLRSLVLKGTNLSYIDLQWLRCLYTLTLTGNRFSNVNLNTDIPGYDKNVLAHVDLSNNGLTDLNFTVGGNIKDLNVSHNNLSYLEVDKAYNLLSLDISYNDFAEIPVANLDSLKTLNAAGNRLSYLELPWQNTLVNLDCRENDFNFSTLPCLPGDLKGEYLYAPQNQIQISSKGPSCNLSTVGLEVDGVASQFVWRKEDGTPLTAGVDYVINNGIVSFIDKTVGNVYCEITNSRYPDLTMTTSVMLVAEAPTNVVGWMDIADVVDPETVGYLSLAAYNDNSAIYIDWEGDGSVYTEYPLKSTYTLFPAAPVAGRRALIYSYDEADFLWVFSITGVPMKKADFSAMTRLNTLTVDYAGTDDIKFPITETLESLSLEGNGFSSIDPTGMQNLKSLSASNNKIKSIDLSVYPNLQLATLANNGMDEIKFDNPNLWHLDLYGNEFTHFSLAGLPALHQVRVSNNHLSSMDIEGPELLRVLRIEGNEFDFNTLPIVPETVSEYNYSDQARIDAKIDGYVVDLSSQANPHGVATQYYWCYDEPYLDEEGTLTADLLELGTDYTIDNGVTRFYHEVANVCCFMLNDLFPKTYLMTDVLNITGTVGVEEVEAAAPVISLDGMTLTISAQEGTDYSVFAIDGETVISGKVKSGNVSLTLPSAGVYIVKAGTTTTRLLAH